MNLYCPKHSDGKENVVRCIRIYIFSLHWLTCVLISAQMHIFSWRLLLFLMWWLPDRRCEGKQRMVDQVLCISRRTSSLLTPVLSPVGSFCTVISILHDCSICNLVGAAISRLEGRNCSRLGRSMSYFSLGTHFGDVHPHHRQRGRCL
jgi:hypothetical protein